MRLHDPPLGVDDERRRQREHARELMLNLGGGHDDGVVDAVLACEEDVLYYLYTNRLTYYAYFGALKRDGENYTTESLQNLIPSTTHYGVDYVIVEPMMKDRMVHAPENPVALYILENHPNKHRLIYTSPTGMIKIYRLLPPSL